MAHHPEPQVAWQLETAEQNEGSEDVRGGL